MTAAVETVRGAGAQAALLPDGRLHLQEGPIDLVIGAEGAGEAVRRAYTSAARRFGGLLAGLVGELPGLRAWLGDTPPIFADPVAGRMLAATWPHRARGLSPMAAVAGAVADAVLAATMEEPGLAKAWVNDGGDIAFHLTPGTTMRVALVPDPAVARAVGTVAVDAASPVRGVATSGAGGRSFSLGIADSVTVLAGSAAAADAAATLIADAVDVDDPSIARRPARELDPDTDLGDRPVTVSVGPLAPGAIAAALDAGEAVARAMIEEGTIAAACLVLRGEARTIGITPAGAIGNEEREGQGWNRGSASW
ncbi:MAG: UPF0280 family protein [Azospirillaceae bacterium]